MKKLAFVALGIALTLGAPTAFAQQDQDQDNNYPQPGAASDEMRFEQLSDQMRDLTGRIEELQHQVQSLQSRMDRLSGDVDMRLQGVEPGNGGAMRPNHAMNEPRSLIPPSSEPPMSSAPRSYEGETAMNNPPPPEPPISSAPPPPSDEGERAMNSPPQAGDPGTLPGGSPQQQYNYAFGLLRDANYPAAEHALRDFVRRYPDNRLSSNAQYWLGETYFVERNYPAAAAAFAQNYQRFPKGPKAAESLLKLGSSLQMLGRPADACRSYAQLDREFPIEPANLKAREANEKRKAQCR
jgi:tol-pal system protein YbgF